MKKSIIIIIALIGMHISSYAQSYSFLKNKFLIGYEVAFPAGDLLSKTSWAGGRIGYAHMIKDNLSIGIQGSWNSFSEYVARNTYQKPDGTGAITSDFVKEVYTVPLTATVHYYFKGAKKILPYAGVGLGTQYADQTLYFNIFSIYDNNWGFVARPEIGVIFPINDQAAIVLNGAYNYATNKVDGLKIDNLQHFAVSIGFSFSSR
jgi:hypothetical protein